MVLLVLAVVGRGEDAAVRALAATKTTIKTSRIMIITLSSLMIIFWSYLKALVFIMSGAGWVQSPQMPGAGAGADL